MDLTRKRVAAAGAVGVAGLLGAMAGVIHAGAVSAGGYSYQQQGCSASADKSFPGTTTEPGCHNFTAQVNQGGGGYAKQWHVASFNLDQTPSGTSAHSGSIVVDPGQGTSYTIGFDDGQGQLLNLGLTSYPLDVLGYLLGFPGDATNPPIPNPGNLQPGTPSAPTLTMQNSSGHFDASNPTNAQVYVGADDNLDNGEHDGVVPSDPATGCTAPTTTKKGGKGKPKPAPAPNTCVANGPSDGGAVQANTHLQGDPSNPQSLAGNVAPTDPHNPVRAADAGFGECADGQCVAADTERRKIYQGGCSSCSDQSVYSDQSTTNWRSPDCNSGSIQNENECGANWQSCSDNDSNVSSTSTNDNDCDDGPISGPYSERGAYYTDPGVMIYEDPDPQSSPALPMYPLCEEYVGTNGVYTCGAPGVNPPAGALPSTPAAGSVHPSAGSGLNPLHVPPHAPGTTVPLGAGPGGA